MSETEQKKKSPLGTVFIVFVLLLGVLVIGLLNNAKQSYEGTTDDQVVAATSETTTTDTTKIAMADPQTADTQTPEQTDLTPSAGTEVLSENVDLNLEALATPRTIGNADAKVKISEHSSFTCGACGAFHKDNFKRIKADYLDTGKAHLVFDDFPRNQYDLQVGAVARCVPEDAYFNFVQLLFETQDDWLNDDFIGYIKQNAKLTGLSEEKIDACLESKDLLEALAQRQRDAFENHDVNATPTLIINDSIKISGLAPYEDIKKVLDAELAK